jgi:hypothetical protein
VQHDTRRAIAWIAHTLVTGRTGPTYDEADGRWYRYAGKAAYDGIQIHGDDACSISGPLTALFNSRTTDYVSLALSGSRFFGLEQGGERRFHGEVSQRQVRIVDDQAAYVYAFDRGDIVPSPA